MKYQKTQIGWWFIVVILLVLGSVIISYLLKTGTNPISEKGLAIVGSILLLCLLSFYRLKIIIKDKAIHLIYGIGLIRIKLRPTDLIGVKEIKTPFYVGLGIRITSSGMLYNIQGNRAVALTFGRDKPKTVKIGSPEPSLLKQAIHKEFGSPMQN